MKSWASLRSSLDRLGREAAEVRLVEQDVGRMQGDLEEQEGLWNQAEVELETEKTTLRVRLGVLMSQVEAESQQDPQLEAEVDALRKQKEFANLHITKQQREYDGWKGQVGVQRKLLQRQKQQLLSELANISAVHDQEMEQAHREQQRLRAEGEALLLRSGKLAQQLHAEGNTLVQDQQKAALKKAELERQVEELEAERQQASNELMPQEQLAQQLAAMQLQLRGETAAIVKVRQDQAELVARCDKEETARGKVLSAEEGKVARQRRESLQLCGAAHGQYGLLRQMLMACEARTSGSR